MKIIHTSRVACLAAILAAAPLGAQQHDHGAMAGMHGMTMPALTAAARAQIDSVATAARPLATTAAATAAGYRPKFGWIPTMGEHWVALDRMSKEKQSDRTAPSNLMFSRIAGKDSLVGAAFAYIAPADDSLPPKLFDGNPPWHEHPDLAPPGMRLIMLHVWFVPSPDGPFAGTNPNLPFWAAGLPAPDSARMHDPAFSDRVRRASLALAELVDSASIFRQVAQRPDVAPMLAARRDSIRALVPEFRAAASAHDAARWDRAAQRAAAQWDAIYAGFMASARTVRGKERMSTYVSMLLGHHEEM